MKLNPAVTKDGTAALGKGTVLFKASTSPDETPVVGSQDSSNNSEDDEEEASSSKV